MMLTEPDLRIGEGRYHRMFVRSLVAVLVLAIWVRPLPSSLWLDELGTWWIVKDELADAIRRSAIVSGQSPLFYAIAWVTREIVGDAEWAVRMPSILLTGGSSVMIYRLGRRFIDVEYGRVSTVAFVVWPVVAFAAADFRPYALATFAVIASTSALVRWLDDGVARWGIACLAFAVIAPYAHHVFALIWPVLIAYVVVRMRQGSVAVSGKALIAAGAGAVTLSLPLAAQQFALVARHDEWVVSRGASIDLLSTVVPIAFVGALLLGGLLAAAVTGVKLRLPRIERPELILVVTWALLPVAALLATTLLTPLWVLQPRYMLVAAPGAALLLGLAIRSVEPQLARRIVLLVLAILSIVDLASPRHLTDWRGAVAAADRVATGRTVSIVQPGFTESMQRDWIEDPERRAFLLAPLSRYPLRGQVVLLPLEVDHSNVSFVRRQVKDAVDGAERVVMLVSFPATAIWLTEYLRGEGWFLDEGPRSVDLIVASFRHVDG